MTEPKKYTKKPVTIEAMQMPTTGDVPAAMAVYQWVEQHIGSTQPKGDGAGYLPKSSGVTIDPGTGMMVIRTLEGDMEVSLGDYVIRGVQGEFYPCKPDIFDATYSPAVAETPDEELTRYLVRAGLSHDEAGKAAVTAALLLTRRGTEPRHGKM